MTTTYALPSVEHREALQRVLDDHHGHLTDIGVSVQLLLAHSDNGKPALKHHGVPALAVTSLVSLKHRVLGLGDALITLDGDRWKSLAAKERLALLDHECHHLDLVCEEGKPQIDSAGRPVLKLRLHDREFGWFDLIAERWGKSSQEVQQLARFVDEAGQVYLFPDGGGRRGRR